MNAAAPWLAIVLCALAHAQDLIQHDDAVFETGTRLVQVDVIARDRNGPIRGLTKDDFELYDNGQRQEISIFAARESNAPPPDHPSLPGVVRNRPWVSGKDPVAATVILVDYLNTEWEDQARARLKALDYLDRAAPNDAIAFFTLNTALNPVQDLTRGRETLREAVRRSSPQLTGLDIAMLADLPGAGVIRIDMAKRKAEITSDAFETIALYLRGIPGRKKLLWISAAMPLTFTAQLGAGNSVDSPITVNEYVNLSPGLFAAMKRMNDANVAVYPIDPRGLFPGVLMDPNLATMIQLADLTGGKAFYADNDLAAGIEQAIDDTELTYTLAFYANPAKDDTSFHALDVRLVRSGADLRYRRGYSASEPE